MGSPREPCTDTTADSMHTLLLPPQELVFLGSGSGTARRLGTDTDTDTDIETYLLCSTFKAHGLSPKPMSRTFIENSYEFAKLTLDDIVSAPNMHAVRHTTDFAPIYDAVFNLVVASEGHRLYALVRSALKHMAQRCHRAHFVEGADLIRTTCIYLEKNYLRTKELPLIMDVAEAFWNTPAIRRWRRFIRFARWTGFIARCRLAFVEVSLRPDASGLAELAERFYRLAGSASGLNVVSDALGRYSSV